jgi:hypothetical protein
MGSTMICHLQAGVPREVGDIVDKRKIPICLIFNYNGQMLKEETEK